jgi:hypothetical protein
MGDKVNFTKLKRQDIFKASFMDFKENNEIEFKKLRNSNIEILYETNGTGKLV